MELNLRYAFALTVGSLCFLASLPGAQEEADRARREVEYAEGLASRFGYTDLAEEVLHLFELGRTAQEFGSELDYARCRIRHEGAKHEGNREKRLELYHGALVAYEAFLEANPRGELQGRARRDCVRLCEAYGRILDLAQQDTTDGQERDALRMRMHDVLSRGLELCGVLADEVGPDPSPLERVEWLHLRWARARILIALGTISNPGTFYFAQAEKVLEDLAEKGSDLQALHAFLLIAKCKVAQGEYAEALDFSEFVLEAMFPLTAAQRAVIGWNTLTPEHLQLRWQLFELGIEDLLTAHRALGHPAEAARWALHFFGTWKREGIDPSPGGHLGMLDAGRTLLDCGGFVGGRIGEDDLSWFATEEAMRAAGFDHRREARRTLDIVLAIAREVNEAHAHDLLGLHAKELLGQVVDRPGAELSPDLLLEVALGQYANREYPQAREDLKRVLRALDEHDEATRRTLAPRTLSYLGRAFRRMERPLEAAMAHREAVRRWRGDPEQDAVNAQGYYQAIGQARRGARGDARIEALWRDAEQLVSELGEPETGAIDWRRAEREFAAGNYAAARRAYATIRPRSEHYDPARVRATLCLYRAGQVADAAAEFRSLADDLASPDPRAILGGAKVDKNVRREARATAVYYLGRIAYEGGDFDATVKTLGDYAERFSDAPANIPDAQYLLLLAHLERQDAAAAREVHTALRLAFPEHELTGRGALRIYEVAKREHEAAQEAGRVAEVRALTREMAELLHLGNSLSAAPAFPNLHRETRLRMEIEEWEHAQHAAERTRELFASDPDRAAQLASHVLPDLGECLLRRKRLAEAFAVLDPLVPAPDEEGQPSLSVARNWCRAAGGWLEVDGVEVVVVPGVGDAADLEAASEWWRRLAEQAERDEGKWTAAWYEVKLEELFCHDRRSTLDSAKRDGFRTRLQSLHTDTTGFADVAAKDVEGTLLPRFRWLWRRGD